MNWPLARISRNRASRSGWRGAYCALTSTSGICTAPHFSGVEPAEDEIRRQRENACKNCIFEIFEIVVEALVARAEAVAESADHEGPDRRADEREEQVGTERHLEDPGRNRDERAHHRCHPADEDAEVAPLVEPALGAVELLR